MAATDSTEAKQRTPREPIERRTFLRNALGGAMGLSVAGGGVGFIGMLWPSLGEGFGGEIVLPVLAADLHAGILLEKAPFEYPAGRMYVVAWDPSLPGAVESYGDAHAILSETTGLMALYQKCVHLGCRVPWCQSSQWYECPCHGSKYNKWGEWMGGPASRRRSMVMATSSSTPARSSPAPPVPPACCSSSPKVPTASACESRGSGPV
jgi:cytochrome b6-f complex iron-sulfur subunit